MMRFIQNQTSMTKKAAQATRNPLFLALGVTLSLVLSGCLVKTREKRNSVENGSFERNLPTIRKNATADTPSAILLGGSYVRNFPTSPRANRMRDMIRLIGSDYYPSYGDRGMYPPLFHVGALTQLSTEGQYSEARTRLRDLFGNSPSNPLGWNFKTFFIDVPGHKDQNFMEYCQHYERFDETTCQAIGAHSPFRRIAVLEAMLLLHNVEVILVNTVADTFGAKVTESTQLALENEIDRIRGIRGEGNFRVILMSQENLLNSNNSSFVNTATADWFENFINENEEVILLVHNSESQSSSNAIIERSRFTTLSGSTQRKCLQDFYIFEPAAVGYETEDPNSQYGYAELFVHRELFAIRNQRFVQDSSQNWRIQPGTSYELDVRLKKALPGSTCDD